MPVGALGKTMPPAGGADVVLRTERLVLRGWRRSDREPFASLNADPEVGEFLFPPVLTPEESDGLIERFEAERAAQGYCPWAVAERSTGAFIGFVGLHGLDGLAPSLPFAPGVEVGWRLARRFWGSRAVMRPGAESVAARGSSDGRSGRGGNQRAEAKRKGLKKAA